MEPAGAVRGMPDGRDCRGRLNQRSAMHRWPDPDRDRPLSPSARVFPLTLSRKHGGGLARKPPDNGHLPQSVSLLDSTINGPKCLVREHGCFPSLGQLGLWRPDSSWFFRRQHDGLGRRPVGSAFPMLLDAPHCVETGFLRHYPSYPSPVSWHGQDRPPFRQMQGCLALSLRRAGGCVRVPPAAPPVVAAGQRVRQPAEASNSGMRPGRDWWRSQCPQARVSASAR